VTIPPVWSPAAAFFGMSILKGTSTNAPGSIDTVSVSRWIHAPTSLGFLPAGRRSRAPDLLVSASLA
jgi:hypothetical protein